MFKTLSNLFQAQSHHVEESLIDANASTLLAHKISQAEAGHTEAKRLLASMIAQEKQETVLLAAVTKRSTDLMASAQKAMNAGNENLAAEAAVSIAELENETKRREETLEALRTKISRLKFTMEKAQRKLVELRQKSVQAVQMQRENTARKRLGDTLGGYGSLSEAEELANRISTNPDQIDAWDAFDQVNEDLNGKSVERKLNDAGHGNGSLTSASDILNRLKAQSTPTSN